MGLVDVLLRSLYLVRLWRTQSKCLFAHFLARVSVCLLNIFLLIFLRDHRTVLVVLPTQTQLLLGLFSDLQASLVPFPVLITAGLLAV